jgi:hypothetical protein
MPGNRAVVHHIIVFVQPPGTSTGSTPRQHFTAYVPGYIVRPFEKGMAKLITAGSKLIFQVHYTPIGTPQTDKSRVAFLYADKADVKRQVVTNVAGNTTFLIPSHASNHRVEGTSREYSKEALLLSLSPHMHLRGKAFRYEAVYPNGTRETLLDVPRYDFNWQTQYALAEPKPLPPGTRLHCVAHFDNSPENLANPDPSKAVRWGDQTWEEMMLGYYEIAFEGEAPPGTVDGRVDGGAALGGLLGGLQGRLAAADPKEVFGRLDANKDGKILRDEFPGALQGLFDRLDADSSNSIDLPELEQGLKRLGRRPEGQ